MVKIVNLDIPEVKVINPGTFSDNRGYFLVSYNEKVYSGAGIRNKFIQDNQSFSKNAGTVRGMHFQIPPFEQAKLVRVIQGSILDVACDMRKTSETRGKWCSAVISAEENNQIFVPAGFAHGFVTLEPDTIVQYKVDAAWSREHERGFIWNDPDMNIDWKVPPSDITISEKDQDLPALNELSDYF